MLTFGDFALATKEVNNSNNNTSWIDDLSSGGKYHKFYEKSENIFKVFRDNELKNKSGENNQSGENLDNNRALNAPINTNNFSIDSVKKYFKNPITIAGVAVFILLIISIFKSGK